MEFFNCERCLTSPYCGWYVIEISSYAIKNVEIYVISGESMTTSLSTKLFMILRYSEIGWVPHWIRANSSLRCITRVCEWLAYDCYNFNYESWAIEEVVTTSITGSKTMAKIAWRIKLSYQNQCQKARFEALIEDDPVVGLGSVFDKQTMMPSRYPRMS